MENMEQKNEATVQNEAMDNHAYLASLAGELMGDTEWKLPPQLRFFLVSDLDWSLLIL